MTNLKTKLEKETKRKEKNWKRGVHVVPVHALDQDLHRDLILDHDRDQGPDLNQNQVSSVIEDEEVLVKIPIQQLFMFIVFRKLRALKKVIGSGWKKNYFTTK